MASDQKKYVNKLAGAHILCIGGTSGIGYAVAEAALEFGAGNVIIASSNAERVKSAVSRLQKDYPSKASSIHGFTASLGDDNTMDQEILTLLNKSTNSGKDKLDHIVFTAGEGIRSSKVDELDIKEIKNFGNVRFFAATLLGKHAPKFLNEGPASSITYTTGTVSQRPIAGWAMTAGFATGLHGLTRGLALDLKPLRVNLISPGLVDTEFWAHMKEEEKQGLFNMYLEGGKLPTGRVATAADIAESYIFAMRDYNMTGTVISTNSGSLLV